MSGSFVKGKRAFWDLCGSENVQIKNYGSGKKDLGSLKVDAARAEPDRDF